MVAVDSGHRMRHGLDHQVALASSGLSHTQRGYESFMADLHESLSDVALVTLLKGSGWSSPPNSYQVPTLRRNHPWMLRVAPHDENRRYRFEQISMALGGWLQKHWQRYSVIHFCDPTLGNVLYRLRQRFHYPYKLLFANCGPLLPHDYKHFDHIQEFTPTFYETANQTIRKSKLSLLPMGIWPSRFQVRQSQEALRAEWKLPQQAFIILCAASLDEPYKRIPFLIETIAALNDPSIFLLLAGQNQNTPHARQTLAQAAAQLPGRFAQLTAPYARMPELYAASDLFILPSLSEGFGKVYLEAMASRRPVLCHRSPNTEWIVRSSDSLVDMENAMAVAEAIRRMRNAPGAGLSDCAHAMVDTNSQWVETQFHWSVLRDAYLDMYERVRVLPSG